jgi:3-oxoacyl-[acyl-carrier-protein] synthase-3
MGVGIIGLGKYIPKNVLTDDEVTRRLGVPPGWVLERTGIETRYVVGPDETASGISAQAARDAIVDAGISADDIDLIIGCTFSGDYKYPAMACTAFQIGIGMASDRLRCDESLRYILVIGTAVQSPYLNWKIPEGSMFFGDGSGAAIVARVPEGFGVLATEVICNGGVFDAVRLRGGGSSYPLRAENIHENLQYYDMDGMETWKQIIKYQPIVIRKVLDKAGLAIQDVDMIIFHQANLKLIEYLTGKMKLPVTKTYTNVARIGNTAEASLPIALCEAVEQGRIKRSDIVVISGVGAGFIFGATVLKWY